MCNALMRSLDAGTEHYQFRTQASISDQLTGQLRSVACLCYLPCSWKEAVPFFPFFFSLWALA